MRLKCKIGNMPSKEYNPNLSAAENAGANVFDIVQGATFTDNFNETLDSGVICIDQVSLIDSKVLKQYQDVYIWNADEEFDGFYCKGDIVNLRTTINNLTDYDASWAIGDTSDDVVLEKETIYVHEENGKMIIEGYLQDMFIYRYLNVTEETKENYRYKDIKVAFRATFYKTTPEDPESPWVGSFTDTFDLTSSTEFFDPENIGENQFYLLGRETGRIIPCTYDNENKRFWFEETVTFEPSEGVYEQFYLYAISSYYPSYRIKNFLNFYTIKVTNVPDNFIDTLEDKKIVLKFNYKGNDFYVNAVYSPEETFDNVYGFRYSYGEAIGYLYFEYNNKELNCRIQITSVGNFDDLIVYFDKIEIVDFRVEADEFSELPSGFFKHLLVDSRSKEFLQVGSGPNDPNRLYRYQINLFSETKRLEKVMLPNISITQSLKSEEKRTCWYYIKQFIELYSPKYKKIDNQSNGTWHYVNKYAASEWDNSYFDGNPIIITNLKEMFDNVFCPEMSLTNLSLKNVLSQIMICKDIIPFVFNNVIYGMHIGANNLNDFHREDSGFIPINNTVSNISSESYATEARREYSGALSNESSAQCVEYIGFRNRDNTFLELSNLTLETRYPIYKINKIYMCYYKPYEIVKKDGSEDPIYRRFMCKQDITPLVLLNSVRNSLSLKWDDYIDEQRWPENIEEFAKYKLCTVGYDVGSNRITGWGTTYEWFTFLWFKNNASYIENMINVMEELFPLGTTYNNELLGDYDVNKFVVQRHTGFSSIIPYPGSDTNNPSDKIKCLMFQIDYQAMYNGAVIHEKEGIDDDDIVTADNCSSALTILEADGFFEKEKMNRIGNENFKITGRYDADNGGADYSRVQQIGTHDSVTDSIIYSREYSIYDNLILANYESTHGYVLKNYYTSVWARYRTYSLMSYGESVKRAENVKNIINFSTTKRYFENEGLIHFDNYDKVNAEFLNFLSPTNYSNQTGEIFNNTKINSGYFTFNGVGYLSDINSFASGNSICFNILNYENNSAGDYIDELHNTDLNGAFDEDKKLYKTTQNWYPVFEGTSSAASDAFVEKMGIYFCHSDLKDYFGDGNFAASVNVKTYFDRSFELPKKTSTNDSYVIGNEFAICKDNKEVIDATFQFNLYSNDENVLISPWASKLTDLLGIYKKFVADDEVVIADSYEGATVEAYIWNHNGNGTSRDSSGNDRGLGLVLKIPQAEVDNIDTGNFILGKSNTTWKIDSTYYYNNYQNETSYSGEATLTLNTIKEVANDKSTITISASFTGECITKSHSGAVFYTKKENITNSQDLVLRRLSYEDAPDTENYYYKYTDEGSDSIVWFRKRPGWIYFNDYAYMYIPKIGDGDVLKLNDKNCQVKEIFFSDVVSGDRKPVSKNMFLALSTQKLDRTLYYNEYTDDTLPEFLNMNSGFEVNQVFLPNNGIISVNSKQLETDYSNTKSIQYYYKDKGVYHFVFGVNLPVRNGATVFDDFEIYSSIISKRNMDVYDSNHIIAGTATNYVTSSKTYGEAQYFDPILLEEDS